MTSAELFDAKEKFHKIDWDIYERLSAMFDPLTVNDTSSDSYDWSLEIYMAEETPADWICTAAHRDEILGWGFLRFWINFPDRTEQYCAVGVLGQRKVKAAPLTGKREKRPSPIASEKKEPNQAQTVPDGMWYFTFYCEDRDSVQRVRVAADAPRKFTCGVTGIAKAETTFLCTAEPRCREKRLCAGFDNCPSRP